jgi:hypothetical protein
MSVADVPRALLVPVVADKYVRGWPPNMQAGEGDYIPLHEVLGCTFPTDAHFGAYSRPDVPPRLKNEALKHLGEHGVAMTLMVFDVDCAEAHREGKPAPDAWFEEEVPKLAALDAAHPGCFVARSKGGYRIIYQLATPFAIRNDDDKARWTLYYRASCAYLARAFGIVADPACADWTRLYRAPHATRDEAAGPEMREVIGDSSTVGVWTYDPPAGALDADIAVAATLAKSDKAWRERVLNPLLRLKNGEGQRSRSKKSPTVSANSLPPATCGDGASVPEPMKAASAWLAVQPAAIQGSGGDSTTYKTVLGLVKGFDLPPSVALDLLVREYNSRCVPPWTRSALEHKVKCAQRAPLGAGYLLPPPKPEIVVTPLEYDVGCQAEAALAASGTLYQRGGVLVHVVRNGRPGDKSANIKRGPNAPYIVEVSTPRLREELTRVATWCKEKEGKREPAHPPKWAPEGLAARGQWTGIPHLEAVVETPVLRPDGTVLQQPGYDAATGILFEPNARYLPVADAPTQAGAANAAAFILSAFSDFPLVAEEHQAALIAAILSYFAITAFDGPMPLVAVDAPAASTGKSLLVDCIAIIATGHAAARMTQATNEDEERKRITSIALAGDGLVLIDNVTRPLGSGVLDAALTGDVWTDRGLGTNKMVRLRLRIVWFATANNLQVVGDTGRRILNVRLDAKMQQPEQRTGFKHPNLLAWLREERPRLVHAALTILRAAFVAGACGKTLNDWGSYEEWSRVVRNAVMFAGLKDPAETRRDLRGRADTEAAALATVLEGLEGVCGGAHMEAQEIADRIVGSLNQHRRLYNALLELRPLRTGEVLNGSSLGYLLRKYRDRVVGDRHLVSRKEGDRQRWWVERLGSAGTGTTSGKGETVSSRAQTATLPNERDLSDGAASPNAAPARGSREEQAYFEALGHQMLKDRFGELAADEAATRVRVASEKRAGTAR